MSFGKLGSLGRGYGRLGSGGGSQRGIRLSASTFPAASAQNTAIGTLSVVGGTGTYTFTLTDSHTNAVQVAGTNGVNLQVGSASSSAGSFSITVHADNGAGSTFDRTFLITATASGTTGQPMGLLLSLTYAS
jgi:hypothetical protein